MQTKNKAVNKETNKEASKELNKEVKKSRKKSGENEIKKKLKNEVRENCRNRGKILYLCGSPDFFCAKIVKKILLFNFYRHKTDTNLRRKSNRSERERLGKS